VMDWAWGLPLALIVLACPLMMVGMMAFGWIFMRGRSGSHGMMMCHGGHGGNGHEGREAQATESADLVAELKAQCERLDQLIARAEEKARD
jgi:hypothetical protein